MSTSPENEIMNYLKERVFNPVLDSPNASESLKKGVRLTIVRMEQHDAAGMVNYYWTAIVGTEKATRFARMMREEGFLRFEEVIDEFRARFNQYME